MIRFKSKDFRILLAVALVSCLVPFVDARGRLLEPAQRSSLWRRGFKSPINRDDDGLNCGGYWHQWQMNSGKCGVCGDPIDLSPRQNEVGGKFANGIISRYYSTNDTFINIIVEVKKNMRGYFEFRLCPEVSESVPVTHACLDKYQLEVAGHGKRFEAMHDGMNHLQIRLPTGVACERCVLQWKWHTALNWGKCEDGSSRTGCGPQEEYYNCADIAILPPEAILNKNLNSATQEKDRSGSAFRYLQTDPALEPIVPIFDFNERNARMSNKVASGEVQVRKDVEPAFPSVSIGKVPKPKGIMLPYLGEGAGPAGQQEALDSNKGTEAKGKINPTDILNRFQSSSDFSDKILARTKRTTPVTPNPVTRAQNTFSMKKTTVSFSGSNAHTNMGRLGSMKGHTGLISPPLPKKTEETESKSEGSHSSFSSSSSSSSASSSSSSSLSQSSPLTSVKWSASSSNFGAASSSTGMDSSVPIKSELASKVQPGSQEGKTVHSVSFVINNTHSGVDKKPHSAVSLALQKLKTLVHYVKEGGKADTIQTVQVTNTPSGGIKKVIRTEIRKKNMGVTPPGFQSGSQGGLQISARDFLNGRRTLNKMSSFSGSVGSSGKTLGGSTEVNVNQQGQRNIKPPAISVKVTNNTVTKTVSSNGHQMSGNEIFSEKKTSVADVSIAKQPEHVNAEHMRERTQPSLIISQPEAEPAPEIKMESIKKETVISKPRTVVSTESKSSVLSGVQAIMSNSTDNTGNTGIFVVKQVSKPKLRPPFRQTVVIPGTNDNYMVPSSMSGPSLTIAGGSLSSRPADLGYSKMSQVSETEARESFLMTQKVTSGQKHKDFSKGSVAMETSEPAIPVVKSETVDTKEAVQTSLNDQAVSKINVEEVLMEDKPIVKTPQPVIPAVKLEATDTMKSMETPRKEQTLAEINVDKIVKEDNRMSNERQTGTLKIRTGNTFSPNREATNSFSVRGSMTSFDFGNKQQRERINPETVLQNVKSEAIEKILREKQEPDPSRKIAHKLASDSQQVRPDTPRTESMKVNTTSINHMISEPTASSASVFSVSSSMSASSNVQTNSDSTLNMMNAKREQWKVIPNQGNLQIETTNELSESANRNMNIETPAPTDTKKLEIVTILPDKVSTPPTILEISPNDVQETSSPIPERSIGLSGTTLPPQIPPSTLPPEGGANSQLSNTKDQLISSPILIKGSINIGGASGSQWGISNGLDTAVQGQGLMVDGLNQGLGLPYDPSYQINFNLPADAQQNIAGGSWIDSSAANAQQFDSLLMDQSSSLTSQSAFAGLSNNLGEQYLTTGPVESIPLPPGETGMMIDSNTGMQNAGTFVPYDGNMMGAGFDQFGPGSAATDMSFTQESSFGDTLGTGSALSSNFGGQGLSSGFDAGIIPSGMDHTLLRMSDTTSLEVGPVLSAGGQVAHDSAFGLGFEISLPETSPPPTTTTTAATTTTEEATTTTTTTTVAPTTTEPTTTELPTTTTERTTTSTTQRPTTTTTTTTPAATTTTTTTTRPTTTTSSATTTTTTTEAPTTTQSTAAPTTPRITTEPAVPAEPITQDFGLDVSVSKTSSLSSSSLSNAKMDTTKTGQSNSYTVISGQSKSPVLTPPPDPVIKQVVVSNTEQVEAGEQPVPQLKAVSAQSLSQNQNSIEGKSGQNVKAESSKTEMASNTQESSNNVAVESAKEGYVETQVSGKSGTIVKTSLETSGSSSSKDSSVNNESVQSQSITVETSSSGKNEISSQVDQSSANSITTNVDSNVNTQGEQTKGRQDPNAILANMFKALTDIMLKVQMGGSQTFPYATDQGKKIEMTNLMDGAPVATTLDKANQVDTQASVSSSSSSMNVESNSVSASEVVQENVKKDKIVNNQADTTNVQTSMDQSVGNTEAAAPQTITTEAPLATQKPPQTEAPTVVEKSSVDTGLQTSGDSSSFSISGSSAVDMNSMSNMGMDGQVLDTTMIDSAGMGNVAPEWGTGTMTGNVDLMMDTTNLAAGANNAWDTTYMFDNTATGGIDMGAGTSGANWDASFVDSALPVDQQPVTQSSAAAWDGTYNIENIGSSSTSSGSSKSVSASSSVMSSSSSTGQASSSKQVQMTKVEEPAQPVVQPLTPQPTLPPTTPAPLPPTTEPPPPPTTRPTTTTQATTPWDASFVNLQSLSGFQISGGGSSQNSGSATGGGNAASSRGDMSYNNYDQTNTVSSSNSFNNVDRSNTMKTDSSASFNTFGSTNSLQQSGNAGSLAFDQRNMMQMGGSSNNQPVIPTESSQAAWGLGVDSSSSNKMNFMNSQTSFNTQTINNNNNMVNSNSNGKWNNFLEVGSSRFDIPVNVPSPTTTTMAPTTTTPLPTEPPVIIDVNDLTPESVDPISRNVMLSMIKSMGQNQQTIMTLLYATGADFLRSMNINPAHLKGSVSTAVLNILPELRRFLRLPRRRSFPRDPYIVGKGYRSEIQRQRQQHSQQQYQHYDTNHTASGSNQHQQYQPPPPPTTPDPVQRAVESAMSKQLITMLGLAPEPPDPPAGGRRGGRRGGGGGGWGAGGGAGGGGWGAGAADPWNVAGGGADPWATGSGAGAGAAPDPWAQPGPDPWGPPGGGGGGGRGGGGRMSRQWQEVLGLVPEPGDVPPGQQGAAGGAAGGGGWGGGGGGGWGGGGGGAWGGRRGGGGGGGGFGELGRLAGMMMDPAEAAELGLGPGPRGGRGGGGGGAGGRRRGPASRGRVLHEIAEAFGF